MRYLYYTMNIANGMANQIITLVIITQCNIILGIGTLNKLNKMEKYIENATQKQVIIGMVILSIIICFADNIFN